MTGLTGAQDLCDLGKSSSAMWSALYSLLKSFDPTKTNDYIGDFAKQWGKPAAGVGIIGSGLDYVKGLLELLETKRKSGYQTIASIIDLVGDGADVVESVDGLTTAGETSVGSYVLLVKMISNTISQGFRSFDKYAADGDFSWSDLSETAIDSSVSGLFAPIDFILSKIPSGVLPENIRDVDAEDISEGIKSFARGLSDKAAQYIINHPDMLDEFNKSDPIKRIGMIFSSIFK